MPQKDAEEYRPPVVLPGQLPLFPTVEGAHLPTVEELLGRGPTVEELLQDAPPLSVLLQGVEVPRND